MDGLSQTLIHFDLIFNKFVTDHRVFETGQVHGQMRSHVITTFIFLISVAAGLTWSNVSQIEQVYDTVLPPKKIDSHGVLSASSPLPDWSDAKLHKHSHYIETLLAVDAGVSRFYGHRPEKMMQAIVSLMHAVNLYASQLNIRIIVVDVVPVKGHNLSLEQFLEWRQDQTGLATHDVAMLIRHRFEGGIAYVNGACKRTGVGVTGFFPEAPFEYASVFFHEMAHLLGLSHDTKVSCECSKKNRHNCLRIDGFEHDCSAQALIELLPSHDCLQAPPEPLPRTNLPICGNGVIEGDEECDCGPEEMCDNVFCEARSCRLILQKDYLYKIFTFSMALVIFSFCLLIRRVIKRSSKDEKTAIVPNGPYISPRPRPVRPEIHVIQSTTTRNGTLACAAPTPDSRLLSPPIVPSRPAPPAPSGKLLDQPVPLARSYSPPPGYTKMFPAKVDPFEKLPCSLGDAVQQISRLSTAIPPPLPSPSDKPPLHVYDQPPRE